MQQIRTVWASLDKRKKIIVLGAGLAMFLGILALSRIATTPKMTLLYAGLENGSAGEVVSALEQQGVQFEIRGSSIYVPASARDTLRMTLASEGLPSNGGRGYELLDSLNGFGTTSQMFDAAYWRAKEGELARTIVASPYVSHARVHIANSTANPFQRSVQPTASVSVQPSGNEITSQQAKAIRYLVASAVTGLSAENVAVIDANGGLIGNQEATDAANAPGEKEQQIRERVLRLVEARVGRGNAVVEVSVETVTDTESIRERRFDPNTRVAISTDVEERSDTTKNISADVTVASNLPDGDGAAGDESNSATSTTRERVNYEVSETELEILRGPGAIKRLTVAVLVNGLQSNGDGAFEPRTDEELGALRELVQSAVGFDPDRGDVITMKSMQLPTGGLQGTEASDSVWQNVFIDAMSLIQLAALSFVTLILGLFVVRPILTSSSQDQLLLDESSGQPRESTQPPALTGELQDNGGGNPAVIGTDLDGTSLTTTRELNAIPDARTSAVVEQLRDMIGDKQEETVEILRTWLEEKEERA